MAISPNSVSIDGDNAGGILFTNDSAAVWSTNVGTLYTDALLTADYDGTTARTTIYFKPFNRTADGKVRAGASSADVSVMGVFPEAPHYPMEWESERPGIVVSVARTGRRRGRVLGDVQTLRNYKLVLMNRTPEALEEFEDFHNYHHPHRQFKYRNEWYGIDGIFTFDSKFKGKAEGRVRGTGDVAIAEVPYSAVNFSANRVLDNVAAKAWGAYGVTKLYRRYDGAAIRIKDNLNVEKDIGFDENGDLDLNQLTGAFPYKIVTWYDQTGNGRDLPGDVTATPTLDTTEVAVAFNNQFFSIPSLSSLSSVEVLVRRKVHSTWATSGGSGGMWTIGSSGSPTALPWAGDSLLYDDTGSTARKDSISLGSFTTATDLIDWHVYSAYSASGDWANYLKGVQKHQTGTNTVGFAASPLLGRSAAGFYFHGWVTSFVIYAGKVTAAERTNLHNDLT